MDSGQASLFRDSLQETSIGGWHVSGFYGNGKSAVVLPAVRGIEEGAIKVFHPELIERYGKDAQLQRIRRESSLVGASHPHLVRILDGGECAVTGHLYVVMERIPQRNLHQALADIPMDAVPKLMAQVASAARFLEDRGLAHRDIKPENIAVSDDFSHATLLDLGVLRPIGFSDLTDVSQRSFIGTLRYSSPEFLLRQEEDTIEGWRAVTFYQLGAVLHDLLMKRPLFHEYGEPFAGLVEAVKSVNPVVQADDARCVNLARRCLIKIRPHAGNWSPGRTSVRSTPRSMRPRPPQGIGSGSARRSCGRPQSMPPRCRRMAKSTCAASSKTFAIGWSPASQR